ncbi:MAG: co-chaperone GroES [Acidobacteriota bacterium]
MATKTKTKSGKKATMKVRPLQDRLLVQRLDLEEEVRGGIIIPDTAKEKPLEAKVIAVGQGRRLDDGSRSTFEVSIGDTVLVGKYSGTEIRLGEEEYLILKEDEVLGIIS